MCVVVQVMNQLKGVCDTESVVVSLWKGCGLKWEELGVKGEDLEELIAREVITNIYNHVFAFNLCFPLYMYIYIYTRTVYCCKFESHLQAPIFPCLYRSLFYLTRTLCLCSAEAWVSGALTTRQCRPLISLPLSLPRTHDSVQGQRHYR